MQSFLKCKKHKYCEYSNVISIWKTTTIIRVCMNIPTTINVHSDIISIATNQMQNNKSMYILNTSDKRYYA